MPGLGVMGWPARGRRAAAATAMLGAAAALALVACGDDETKPAPHTTTTTSSAGGGSDGGGGSGDGGAAQGGGGQGGQGSAACGNGVAEPGEGCDGADLGGLTCQSFGFDMGDLACSASCVLDTAGCSGVEQCQDGMDNDGDGAADCVDTECAAACADACAAAPVLPDPASVSGDTAGHAPLAQPAGCADVGAPAVAYEFTATEAGFLDVELTSISMSDLSVSVRSSCGSAMSELACVNANGGAGAVDFLSIPIAQNETVYVVVSGTDAAEPGQYGLYVNNRVPSCGDAIQDPAEACDDGNMEAGDGCSAACALEPTEVEDNGDAATANAYAAPFVGAISPAGDVDVVSVVVPSGPTSLVAETSSVTVSACPSGLLDSFVEILDASGASVLASDDDSGPGLCGKAIAPGLPAGTYLVRVKAGGAPATFPYRLNVTPIPDVCGDNSVTPGEQCDDGNTAAGDGCSASCQIELDESEPNGAPGEADPYGPLWQATISPALDEDLVSVVVPGPSSTLLAAVGDAGSGACAANQLDSFVEILSPGGGSVIAQDDDAGPGYCSFASASGLSAGTYLVRVKASPFQANATFLYSLTLTTQ